VFEFSGHFRVFLPEDVVVLLGAHFGALRHYRQRLFATIPRLESPDSANSAAGTFCKQGQPAEKTRLVLTAGRLRAIVAIAIESTTKPRSSPIESPPDHAS
jgi:hypothetical protein